MPTALDSQRVIQSQIVVCKLNDERTRQVQVQVQVRGLGLGLGLGLDDCCQG